MKLYPDPEERDLDDVIRGGINVMADRPPTSPTKKPKKAKKA